MSKPGFYNDNAARAYPFVKGTVNTQPPTVPATVVDIPNDIVVDAGFLVGLKSQFDAETHEIYLEEIRREGSQFFFEFRSDAPGLFQRPLTFMRAVGDEDELLEFTDNFEDPVVSVSASGFSASGSTPECDPEPLWSGFLVTGSMTAIATLLPSDDTIARVDSGDALIEPALIRSMVTGYVDSLQVANNDRTRVTAADGCPEVTWTHPTDIIFLRETCIRGDVRFKAGFNSYVQQSDIDNLIEIGALAGAGEGQPCEEVPLFDGEDSASDGDFLGGGLACGETVRSINGVGGRLMNILSGAGASITPDPNNNRVIINLDMSGLALCYTSESP
jgi:hypothetical protein